MSDDVTLTYKRVGETYEGDILGISFSGFSFAAMMTQVHRVLVNFPESAQLYIKRTDREGLLPAKLEPALLKLLREDPVAYISANTVPDRVLDLRGTRASRLSKLAESDAHVVPKSTGLRHGLDTLAAAFGESLYAKGRLAGARWLFEHPGTGRWSDLNTIEHWLESHATEVQPIDEKRGYLIIATGLLLRTDAERFYYPREWNDFGSWITKEQLQTKLEQFRKDKANVTR